MFATQAEPRPAIARRWWSDALWVSLANLSQAAGPFLGLLLLTRMNGLAAAGEFAFAQAVTAPLAQLLNFQLRALLLTCPPAEFSLRHASGIRSVSLVPALLLAAVLAAVLGPLTGLWMIARTVDSWADVFQADAQRQGRLPHAAMSVISRSVLLIATLTAAPSLESAAAFYVMASLILLVMFDWSGAVLPPLLDWHRLRPAMHHGFLLGLMLFLHAASAAVPRIVLEQTSSAAVLGLFASQAVLLQVGNLLASSYGQALLPRMPSAPLRRLAFWCALPAAAALAAFGIQSICAPFLFDLLRIADEPASRSLLFELSLAQVFIWPAAVVGYAMTARRLYQPLLRVGIAMAISSALLSAIAVPRWGASGAALVLATSSIILLAGSFSALASSKARQ